MRVFRCSINTKFLGIYFKFPQIKEMGSLLRGTMHQTERCSKIESGKRDDERRSGQCLGSCNDHELTDIDRNDDNDDLDKGGLKLGYTRDQNPPGKFL